MFIGHFAVGFAAKRIAPTVSLGTLFLAAQFVDILWPVFLLTGLEAVSISPGITRVTPLDFTHYPITHSLAMTLAWALLFAAVYSAVRGYSKVAWVLAVAVVSHWFLDLVAHRPDLPLYPGGDLRVGLGLWNSLGGTIVVEVGLFAVGALLYAKGTRAINRTGSIALAGLVLFLLAIYFVNVLGPPPPSPRAIAWAAQSQWLLVLWAYWIDHNRQPVDAGPPAARLRAG